MSKQGVHEIVQQRHDLHNQQDRDLANKVGLDKMNPGAGIDSKIPLRVTSQPVQQGTQTIRKETVVKK